MNIKATIISLGVLFWASLAFAGYSALDQAFTDYQSTYYQETQQSPAGQPAQGVEPNDDFDREIGQIEQQRLQWDRSMGVLDYQNAFYRPRQDLYQQLQAAQSNPTIAADVLKTNFSIEELETLTLLLNPQIKSDEERFQAAVDSFSYVANLDEILRRYTAFTEGVMPGVGPMKGKDSIKMKFPFPGVLALKGQIVAQNVSAAREMLEIGRRTILTSARKTFWNLHFVEDARAITQQTLQLLTRLEKVAVTRYESGHTSYQDVVKARIKRKLLKEDLDTLKEKQKNLEVKIRELLNLGPKIVVDSPRVAPLNRQTPALDSLYGWALDHRQELRRLRFKIGQMERMIEMAETMIMPSYALNFSLYEDEAVTQVGSTAMRPTFPTSIEVSTGVGLPKMPWFGTQDAYLRQTRKKLLSMKQQLVSLESATRTQVRLKWFALDQALREEKLYRQTIVKLSQSALEVSNRGYESGNVVFADVINSYTIWLQSNLTLVRKRSDLGIAWADLEQVLGSGFPVPPSNPDHQSIQ